MKWFLYSRTNIILIKDQKHKTGCDTFGDNRGKTSNFYLHIGLDQVALYMIKPVFKLQSI